MKTAVLLAASAMLCIGVGVAYADGGDGATRTRPWRTPRSRTIWISACLRRGMSFGNTRSSILNVMGYCIGGTLLAMALAWLAARGDDHFGAATFIVSLQDFSKVGDTALFLGESNVDFIEQQMLERGYLDSREMSKMFNLLRSNDLIWSNAHPEAASL
jgi:hypothetical protein